jgi:glycosyltransferase involved in cell wall biosynthesis
VIIVDDASTDETPRVLSDIMAKYEGKIKILSNKINKGIAYNSNYAFEHSSGEYLSLIGDDDEWIDKDKITKQLTCFKNNENKTLGLVGTWWVEVGDGVQILQKPKKPRKLVERMLMGGGIICGSSVLLTRRAWQKVGGFDAAQKRGTDSDLFRRIIISGFDLEILEDVMVNVYLDHGYSRMTPSKSVESIEKEIYALKLNIHKLYSHYSAYPKAHARYQIKISSCYQQLFMETLSIEHQKRSLRHLQKSIYLNPLQLSAYHYIIKATVKYFQYIMFNRRMVTK